jgi:hypothetical protein
MSLVREPDAGNPPVRFDEREVETEHGMRLLRHRRGNPDPDVLAFQHTLTLFIFVITVFLHPCWIDRIPLYSCLFCILGKVQR